MINRELFPTDSKATRILLKYNPPIDKVVECCAGNGDITRVLLAKGYSVWENDLYDKRCNSILDINYYKNVEYLAQYGHSLVTNPPFTLAWNLLESAIKYFKYIALYLSINFLEPTDDRWNGNIKEPNHIIILPRLSHTGDGLKDKKTCFWGVWNSDSHQTIRIISKEQFKIIGGV